MGRHILGVPAGASVASITAARDILLEKWIPLREAYFRAEDPVAIDYIDGVIALIQEAFQDIGRTITTIQLI